MSGSLSLYCRQLRDVLGRAIGVVSDDDELLL